MNITFFYDEYYNYFIHKFRNNYDNKDWGFYST